MSFQLDEATLVAMTQEARACFLEEDAPNYLQALEEGLQQRHNPNFTELLRATHSLKGGAGLAQLPSLGELAHRLEDLLQAIWHQTVPDVEESWTLLEWGIFEVANLLDQARIERVAAADPTLLSILASLTPAPDSLEDLPGTIELSQPTLIQTALIQDLEVCLTTVESLAPNAPSQVIGDTLAIFFDECLLLGETLDLPWLIETIEPLESVLAEATSEEAKKLALQIIPELRSQRQQFLDQMAAAKPTVTSAPIPEEKAPLSQVRVPLKRLEAMTHSVEELILTQERMRLQQQHLQQANQRIRELSQAFEPIREQIQSLYDQLALTPVNSSGLVAAKMSSQPTASEFDALELDRYTELHTSLQTFQELMLRIQETRADLDLVNRDFSEDLERVQGNLDKLHNNLTQSRLVPFRLLAQRFIPQLQNLNRRYGKSANLLIEGEETLVDQVLLEHLQTPLTHLLNNAFDHGIESVSDRSSQGKPETAQILLKAQVDNNTLVLQLRDDGRGIDLRRVFLQAQQQGLCSMDTVFEDYQPEQILEWIFQPNFSTAATVSDLSGRGVGLDIVRTQIQRLRGTIQVKTQPHRGTTFILKLPLNLSLMSLFLVQLEHRIVAFPNLSILETLSYNELEWLTTNSQTVTWRGQTIPALTLSKLLPCPQSPLESVNPRLGLVIAGASTPFVIAANRLIGERLLIVKPFDETIVPPAYLAGCTILGSGEIVPVLLPEAFEIDPSLQQDNPPAAPVSDPTHTPTILIAEDSVATRRLLERLLTQVGYTTIVCRDGQEALDTLCEYPQKIHLIISDVEMPRLNGFELLQQIRSHRDWQHIRVIMATSRTGDRHQHQAMQLGVNAYLGKPIQPQELLMTIEALLQ